MVDGVYASYAINREHVHGDGATAKGITTSYALFKDGLPRLIAGSPGYGWSLSVRDGYRRVEPFPRRGHESAAIQHAERQR